MTHYYFHLISSFNYRKIAALRILCIYAFPLQRERERESEREREKETERNREKEREFSF